MRIRTTLFAVPLLAAGSLLLAPAGPAAHAAQAAAPAKVTVTIKAEGVELFGKVSSKRKVCVAERNVRIIQQFGARGGGDDVLFHADTSDEDGFWNGGNTGIEGRFYARVQKNDQCRAAVSSTVRAVRND